MKLSRNGTIIIVLLVILCICVCIGVPFFTPKSGTETPTPSVSATAEETATEGPSPTPAPTETATLAPVGKSRDNPFPSGDIQEIENGMTISIPVILRPANRVVKNANQFNTDPKEGQEYIQINVDLVCNKEVDEKCSVFVSNFKLVGSDGNVIQPSFVADVEGELENGEFFGGSEKGGKLFYVVQEGDEDVVLFYDPFLGSEIYFALPNSCTDPC